LMEHWAGDRFSALPFRAVMSKVYSLH
jgi:hypothetical protein